MEFLRIISDTGKLLLFGPQEEDFSSETSYRIYYIIIPALKILFVIWIIFKFIIPIWHIS
jgi:hypothetical protein